MTKQNANLFQLLFFDTTITSKFNLAVFFKKLHSGNNNRAFSKIEGVEYETYQVMQEPIMGSCSSFSPSSADECEARVGDW